MANERRIRLIQVAKEFNVGINTITDFLQKKGVKSDGSPNALVDAETYALLEKEFGAGRAVNSERVNIRERIAQKQATVTLDDDAKGKGGKNDEELLVKSNVISVKDEVASMGPKILGKIDLSGKGPKAAPAATPAPAPRPAAKPAPTPAPAPAAVPAPAEPVVPTPVEVPEPQPAAPAVEDDHVYCLTPQGRVVELPAGATPVDFAYQIHTQLGHRCRGAKVDGMMVPLNTKLKTGQTVEIIAAKVGQPSRDWLNPELGYAASPRTRNKVRQWFNAEQLAQQIAEGRDRLDKELARLGKTAVKLDDLAKRLGFGTVDELCVAFAKEEITLTALAQAVQPPKPAPAPAPEHDLVLRGASSAASKGKVLIRCRPTKLWATLHAAEA